MSRNIRIRTELNPSDNYVKIQLKQDFDFLEILSLKISQEDVYRSFYSNYGVVVGRVIMNSGVGVPNTRVSIFIPLTDEDAQDPEISTIYPYSDISVLNEDGVRFNTLPKDAQGVCHAPVGTFPTKREIVDNDLLFDIYEKYYKYTTTTNGAGDFMLFGVPVGNHVLNADVDTSDMGIFSQRPYDFIEQGNPKKLFESPTKFKSGNNLNNLTQLKNRQVGVNVIPFWGEGLDNEIGISRVDIDINYNIRPQAIFMGSIFGDNEKNSVNKNCRPRKKMGKVCEMSEGEGTIEMIRKNVIGETEKFDLEGGQLINDNGAWAYQVPMNLDYMVTDEFGELSPSDDPNKGIPTRSRMRFKISINETGGNGRLRTKAKFLVPHNPESLNEVDYSFDESTPDTHFSDFYWNKIYTVKNHIARFQKDRNEENRNFIGLKDVDDCVGLKNPIPFNKLDVDFNPLFSILCIIINIIIFIVDAINRIVSFEFTVGPFDVKPFSFIDCIILRCPLTDVEYKPGCRGKPYNGRGETSTCFELSLASALNVFEFDFYNDWINGALYSFLLKYKRVNSDDEKFCGSGNGLGGNYIMNTNPPNGNTNTTQRDEIDEGVVVSYKNELFYKPLTNEGHKFYSADIYNLGATFNCDWQGKDKVQKGLISTSYQIPPFVSESSTTGLIPLLFNLNCIRVSTTGKQSRSIRKICEIGVGLDEGDDRNNEVGSEDIENPLLRSQLIKLNDPNFTFDNLGDIASDFEGDEYISYRGLNKNGNISQYKDSFFFYFGSKPNNTALELMVSKYFTDCSKGVQNILSVIGVVSNVTTVNGADGSINITVRGGLAPYDYKWYRTGELDLIGITEDIPESPNTLTEGSYYVIVEDSNGLKTKKTFIVSGLQNLLYGVSIRDTISEDQSTGIIFINLITGGIGPYKVELSGEVNAVVNDVVYGTTFGDITASLDANGGLPYGDYTVTITDSNTPPEVVSFDVVIGVPSTLMVSDTRSGPNCADYNDGNVTINIEGGTPIYSITFKDVSDPDENNHIVFQSIINNGVAIYDNLPPSTYEYFVADEYGQVSTTQTFTLVEPLDPYLYRSGILVDVPPHGPLQTLKVTNLIIGQTYTFKINSSESEFVAQGVTKNFGFIPEEVYQVISEFGCTSNITN